MPLRAVILDIDGSSAELSEGTGAFIRAVAERLPVGVCSTGPRDVVVPALERAGVRDLLDAIVCIDDVDQGRPDPGGHLLAIARLNEERGLHESIVSGDALAVEGSEDGVHAARAAGMRCAALAGDQGAERAADMVIGRLDAAAARDLTG